MLPAILSDLRCPVERERQTASAEQHAQSRHKSVPIDTAGHDELQKLEFAGFSLGREAGSNLTGLRAAC